MPAVSAPATQLPELPYFFLSDKSQWGDFKRSLNNCGLSWSLSDWMTTILFGGADYLFVSTKMAEIDAIFQVPDIIGNGEAKDKQFAVMETSQKLLAALGISKSENIQPSQRFCNLSKLQFEPDSKLPSRQKMWIVKSLQGTKHQPGPFYYLTQQCEPYDTAHRFKR